MVVENGVVGIVVVKEGKKVKGLGVLWVTVVRYRLFTDSLFHDFSEGPDFRRKSSPYFKV